MKKIIQKALKPNFFFFFFSDKFDSGWIFFPVILNFGFVFFQELRLKIQSKCLSIVVILANPFQIIFINRVYEKHRRVEGKVF